MRQHRKPLHKHAQKTLHLQLQGLFFHGSYQRDWYLIEITWVQCIDNLYGSVELGIFFRWGDHMYLHRKRAILWCEVCSTHWCERPIPPSRPFNDSPIKLRGWFPDVFYGKVSNNGRIRFHLSPAEAPLAVQIRVFRYPSTGESLDAEVCGLIPCRVD
jgi:hypothetical protein